MTLNAALPWIIFTVSVLAVLALDLGVFHRKSHAVSVREATIWTVVWIALAMAFAVGVYFFRGSGPALEFLSGYVIEKALSVDNIFVFVLIFTMFRVPASAQHRVLFWGVLGAFALRGLMIGVGAVLIARFSWILYIFGAFLIYTGIKMALHKGDQLEVHENPIVRYARRHLPISPHYSGSDFTVHHDGKRFFTPLALVLIVIETTDVVFAVDSIPAIFAITRDPFIVYTSNVFAILGLRALYFLLAGIIDRFYYLKHALSVILTFVGVKMTISNWLHISISVSLAVIVATLTVAMIASVMRARRIGPAGTETIADPRVIPEDADVPEDLMRD